MGRLLAVHPPLALVLSTQHCPSESTLLHFYTGQRTPDSGTSLQQGPACAGACLSAASAAPENHYQLEAAEQGTANRRRRWLLFSVRGVEGLSVGRCHCEVICSVYGREASGLDKSGSELLLQEACAALVAALQRGGGGEGHEGVTLLPASGEEVQLCEEEALPPGELSPGQWLLGVCWAKLYSPRINSTLTELTAQTQALFKIVCLPQM
ncbi:hypothetical protein AOLI_G00124440 [Acnodon oligacanthus]